VTPVSIGLGVVFGAWFALCVLAHLHSKVRRFFPRLEARGLLPHWNFFAPRPGVHDTHLLFRDVGQDGEVGNLGYVPMIGVRRWYHVLWHPDKFRSKVVSDIASMIPAIRRQAHRRDADDRLVMLTQPYVLALHLVMVMPHEPAARARQFILAQHRTVGGEAEHQLLYLSEYHPFTTPSADPSA
jgi:hypothetical protein